MKLTKTIPAGSVSVEFAWAYKSFAKCDEAYRRIRNGCSAKMQACDWCKRAFEDDEWFAIAQPKPKQYGPNRNWALCHACADIIGAPERKK